ncbi:hypothetical protein [Tateyamaria sp. SN6-1]|uniref:hypothetical protein n=1 Tax=Tateyamaria sp. SN6-1 TaxID=3092148 RepID=UPI0039F51F2F
MKRIFSALAFALCATQASAQIHPQHYDLSVEVQYQVTEATEAAAEAMGIEQTGVFTFDMLFPRPACLAHYQSGSASYYSTDTTLTAFDSKTRLHLRSEPRLQIANDLSGVLDRVLFVLRPDMRLKSGQVIERMTLTSDVALSALSSNAFVEDSRLLQEILNEDGAQVFVFLDTAPQAAVIMDVVGAGVSISNRRGNAPRNQIATCTPPAGFP